MTDYSSDSHSGEAIGQAGALIQFGAYCAVVAGIMGVAAIFIGHQPQSAFHEALYATIDFGLLFATLGIWLAFGHSLGRAGLAGFVVALTGIASILGPEPNWFGLDFYWLGSVIFVLGMAVLSVQLVRSGFLRAAASMWLAALAVGLLSAMLPGVIPSPMAGLCLEIGFVLAGVELLRRRRILGSPQMPATNLRENARSES